MGPCDHRHCMALGLIVTKRARLHLLHWMKNTIVSIIVLAALGAAAPASAQTELTLAEAVARGRSQNLDVRSAAAAEREASQRVTEARAGYLPKVDVSESWQRSNQPVFVFSSLLAQRRFTVADFAVEALNHPGVVDNFHTAVLVEQSLFDGGTGPKIRAARIGRDVATAERLLIDHNLVVDVAAAYGRVLVAAAARQSTAAAVEAARSDRELASNRRDAGLVTDADVLQLDVHVARSREQQIRAESDERIARARLNQVMGEPLGATFTLDFSPSPIALDGTHVSLLEAEALKNRPDVKLAELREQLAGVAQAAARAAFLPEVTAQGGWELNGGTWGTRASNWTVGTIMRLNVFHGFADRARLAQAREHATRRALERDKAEIATRLDLRTAIARLDSARAREAVGRAAVTQARESRRIVRDRYEGGLTDVASLLRAEDALLQAETQETAARVDVLVESAALERAAGR